MTRGPRGGALGGVESRGELGPVGRLARFGRACVFGVWVGLGAVLGSENESWGILEAVSFCSRWLFCVDRTTKGNPGHL